MIANLVDAALALSQSLELSIVLKATAVVALALVGARLAARARAAVRHLLLASGFAALLALPLAAVLVPKLSIDVPTTRAATESRPSPLAVTTPISIAATGPIPAGWDLPSRGAVARTVWMAGVVLCVTPLALMLWRLRQIRRTGLPFAPQLPVPDTHPAARRVQFLEHEDVAAPMTFGLWRPVVVMPPDARDWSPADLQRALIHELEHVRRSDWAVHVLGRLVCAVYWFHPLVWLAGRQLSLEAERACDDAVVASSESTDYAEQLVVLAGRLSAHNGQPLLGMASRSDLSARVSALLDSTQRRGRASAWMAAGVVGIASVIVLTVAPLTAVARVAGGDAVAAAEPRQGPSTGSRRTRALDRALYEAASDGDLADVIEILAAGANVDAVIEGDGSPLIGGARSGNIAIVSRLVDAGADPNLPVEGDGSPLIMAAAHGHLDIVQLLLDRGADVNQIVKGDENALMCASEGGHLPVVQLLVRRGANVHERIWTEWAGRQGEWRTAVSQARKNRHTAVVSYLMSVGARD